MPDLEFRVTLTNETTKLILIQDGAANADGVAEILENFAHISKLAIATLIEDLTFDGRFKHIFAHGDDQLYSILAVLHSKKRIERKPRPRGLGRKAVKDLTTGIVYASQQEAADAIGVFSSDISKHLKEGTILRGHEFVRVDKDGNQTSDSPKLKRKGNVRNSMPVKDTTTGIVYSSQTEAAKAIGVTQAEISSQLKRGGFVRGSHFVRVDKKGNLIKESSFLSTNTHNRRPIAVKDVETDVVYASLNEAAKAFGVSRDTIMLRLSPPDGYIPGKHQFVRVDVDRTIKADS